MLHPQRFKVSHIPEENHSRKEYYEMIYFGYRKSKCNGNGKSGEIVTEQS
jgi:hypothetical protein